MLSRFASLALLVGAAACAGRQSAPVSATPAEVQANDNRTSGGRMQSGALQIRLAIVEAPWHPVAPLIVQ